MDEDKRIKAISRYANMLTYSTDILLVAFKDEAERLNIELVKKIKSHVDCQSTT